MTDAPIAADARRAAGAPCGRRLDDGDPAVTWGIAVETPIEIDINGAPWTVMMATPADLEDLAIGLALTERVVTDIHAVERITIANYLDGIAVDLTRAGAAH